MLKRSLFLLILISGTSYGDIFPKNLNRGDEFIRITRETRQGRWCNGGNRRYTMIKFERCQYDGFLYANLEGDETITIAKNCRPLLPDSERQWFLESRFNELRKSLRTHSTTSLLFGIFTGTFIGVGEAGLIENIRSLIRKEVLRDQDISVYNSSDTRNMSMEEEDRLFANPLNERGSMNIVIEDLQNALQRYNKKYPRVCPIEQGEAPATPPSQSDSERQALVGSHCVQS